MTEYPTPAHLDYNLIDDDDSYKGSHPFLMPNEVARVYSYAESRGGQHDAVMSHGLQGWLAHRLMTPITAENIEESADFAHAHGTPFAKDGWRHILNKHGGFLPLDIRGVEEGMMIPVKTPMISVTNLDEGLPWLAGKIETSLLRNTWLASSLATRFFHAKLKIKKHFDRTADGDYSGLPFAFLDFSSRGVAGYDANEVGGTAYLTCFMGSDSKPAVRYCNRYYHSKMSGFSGPATEHSIMCEWGSDGPTVIRALLGRAKAMGAKWISIVGDTWNIYNFVDACANMASEFQEAGITLVVRPDSGKIADVLTDIIPVIAAGFGSCTNGQGFEVLNGVKVLWPDGIDEDNLTRPFQVAETLKVSAVSIMVASGGGMFVHGMERDLQKWAFKASAKQNYGETEWIGLAKDPITDPGKRSKMGRHIVLKQEDGSFQTLSNIDSKSYDASMDNAKSLLIPRYTTAKLLNQTSIDTIRTRVDSYMGL